MQELKNLAKDPQDFGISFGSNKISSEKKGESECSYDLSTDEENKSQNKKGKLKIVDEDKFLSDLKKENERLEKELTNITHPQIRESINLPISAERPQTRVRRERDAKKVCSNCSQIVSCRNYARSNNEIFGVWGGETEIERYNAGVVKDLPQHLSRNSGILKRDEHL